MSQLLSHPLLILMIGAVISGLLIPAINRRHQDHQKTLEIKTGLVSEISESVVQIVMATQFHHFHAKSLDQAGFDQAYRDWEIKSAVIHTKLEAYFSRYKIPGEWCEFSEIVTGFYALEGMHLEPKAQLESTIREKLAALQPAGKQQKEDWVELRDKILRVKAELIDKVLRTRISLLQPS